MSSKKHMLRAIAFVLTLCSVAVMFTGCGRQAVSVKPYVSSKSSIPTSRLIASNENYELNWDADGKAVVFKSVQNGEVWSDILYEAFLQGSMSANGNSPISITVSDSRTLAWDTITSAFSLEEGSKMVCKKIKNGIKVIYYFEKYKISVPVDYTLYNDHFNVSINTPDILEDGSDYKLVSVLLTPHLCSVKNDAENGYIFVPSGSGALMYSKEAPEGVRKFTSEMYDADGARQEPGKLVDYLPSRLPVFGVAGNGKGMLGIIDNGAGAAVIEAQAGNPKLGYSNVGANFYVRGYDTFLYSYAGKPESTTRRIGDDMIQTNISVNYYPLLGEDANYNGMAKKYREYLLDKGLLKKSELSESAYGITFWGGTNVTKSILGIPKQDTVPLTTFAQAEDVLKDLSKQIGAKPVVRMLGYGDNGIASGTIGGGKKYDKVYGSKKDLTALINTVGKNNLFMDSDIVTYAKSGAGYSLGGDVAKTAIMYKAEHFTFSPTRKPDEENPYYIISRENLLSTLSIATKKAEKYGNTGISLSTLGSIAFSDYQDYKYINKNGIERDVAAIIASAKKSGYKIAVAEPNSYAACAADMLFDVVTESAHYSAFNQDIPFYQLVFHSYKPMYSSPVNLSENIDFAVARAAASGMGLGFTLTSVYQDESNDLDEYKLYGTLYEDNDDGIKEALITKGYMDVYSKTMDAELVSYTLLNGSVAESKFSNGVTLYTNLTDSNAESPVGTLEPYQFKIG